MRGKYFFCFFFMFFCSVFSLLKIKAQDVTYGLPQEIWQNCRYNHNGEWLLDMASERWCNLSVSDQQSYAKAYQEGYARAKGLDLEKIINKSGAMFEFRLIPPGRFWRGSPEEEVGRNDREKRHKVVISNAYYIQKTEITQIQWRSITGESPFSRQIKMEENDSHAAAYISWDNIKGKMLTKMGEEYRLPTEAQWEYACRGGTTGRYYWGESESEIGQYANSDWGNNSFKYIAPVMSFKPNAFGLYDMIGNVWEWCEDMFQNYTGEDLVDPCNISGSKRVFRGGSCYPFGIRWLRSACRGWDDSSLRNDRTGARLLLRL
ncbi:MAG: SUMF1/EgtB/PvdO family nonheme iron enzyme [Candidatus Brocadiae bacterium]|nr:SUMF1/EgtB/PvdO family nonheme iron enzyme [Candidatus Brocadiia bacterium]